jgi:hypothetical protein
LDTACSLLWSEVLDLVLYVELQIQERRGGQNSDVLCFFSSAGMEKISAAS